MNANIANNISVRAESVEDYQAVYEVHQQAFGQDAEPKLVDQLRDSQHAKVSLVAEYNNIIVGHIMFSEIQVVNGDIQSPALILAPMAVSPAFQRKEIGSTLVREGIVACKRLNYHYIFVLGHINFYPRFGFSSTLASEFESEFPVEAFMAIQIKPEGDAIKGGKIILSPPFAELS